MTAPAEGPPPPQIERTRRQRVLLGGKLVYGQFDFTADCTIRDLTEAGARIRIGAEVKVPDQMWLISVASGMAYRAVAAWRRGTELGLRFDESIDLKPSTSPAPLHIRQLWLETAAR